MRTHFKNNQYNIIGEYLFPDVETKTIIIETHCDEFFQMFFEAIGLPPKYRHLFKLIYMNRTKGGFFNFNQNLYLIEKNYKLATARVYLSFLNAFKYNNKKLLIKQKGGIIKINPEFDYMLGKDWSLVIEYKVKNNS